MRPQLALPLSLSAFLLSGCFAVGTRGNGMYYGGGGISLFVIILVLALLFGRRRR